eukprot:gene3437-3932_t
MEGAKWEPPIGGKIRLKMKRRKSVHDKVEMKGEPLSPLTNIQNIGLGPKEKLTTSKRRNPFQCNANSKRSKLDEYESSSNDLSLFKISRGRSFHVMKENIIEKRDLNIVEPDRLFEQHSTVDGKLKPENDPEILKETEKDFTLSSRGDAIPTDWSLKTKLKFRSDISFSWCTNLTTTQSARGIVDFTRCNNLEINNNDINEEEKLKMEFKKNLFSWIHPNLPFVPSFPVSQSVMKTNSQSLCKDEQMQNELMKHWSHSFQSIFTLSKCGFCPYFYFCCQSYTILFIGANIFDSQMRAVITPTTKGFREMLQKDGIEFDMPLFNKEPSNVTIIDQENYDNGLENDVDSDKENVCNEDEDFLTSIGLSLKNFSSIKERQMADEITKLQSIDRRPKSTIVVSKSHVIALFNFLINSDSILSQSGPYQGVPPTLLAPVAFEGASLRMLKCVQGPMKFQDNGSMKQMFGLEITGHILPTQLQGICNILKAKHCTYESNVASFVPSSALNCVQECQTTPKSHADLVYSQNLGITQQAHKHIKARPLECNRFLTGFKFADAGLCTRASGIHVDGLNELIHGCEFWDAVFVAKTITVDLKSFFTMKTSTLSSLFALLLIVFVVSEFPGVTEAFLKGPCTRKRWSKCETKLRFSIIKRGSERQDDEANKPFLDSWRELVKKRTGSVTRSALMKVLKDMHANIVAEVQLPDEE